jgi:hypothetical protein
MSSSSENRTSSWTNARSGGTTPPSFITSSKGCNHLYCSCAGLLLSFTASISLHHEQQWWRKRYARRGGRRSDGSFQQVTWWMYAVFCWCGCDRMLPFPSLTTPHHTTPHSNTLYRTIVVTCAQSTKKQARLSISVCRDWSSNVWREPRLSIYARYVETKATMRLYLWHSSYGHSRRDPTQRIHHFLTNSL